MKLFLSFGSLVLISTLSALVMAKGLDDGDIFIDDTLGISAEIPVEKLRANAKYDYIVVGSGAGGAPLASRIAKAGYTVLVLEAGENYNSANVTTPGLQLRAGEDENIEFDYRVFHYKNSHNTTWYPRGMGIGGSTIINAMISQDAQPTDWDYLARYLKDESWSHTNMRQYFKRIEANKYLSPDNKTLAAGHGFNGWLQTSLPNPALSTNPEWADPQVNAILGTVAGGPLPLTPNGDVNGNSGQNLMVEGWHQIPSAVTTDFRRSSARDRIVSVAKLLPTRLTIKTGSFVSKILISRAKQAIGVEYIAQSHASRASPLFDKSFRPVTHRVFAKKEIIISAGTYQTPQLLMLSGIGAEKELKRWGIPMVKNLPGVGKNLQDRYEININWQFKNTFKLLVGCKFLVTDPCYKRYVATDDDVYTVAGPLIGMIEKSAPKLVTPDLYTLLAPIFFRGYIHGLADEAIKHFDTLTLLILKAHTANNAGTVSLRSKDPRDFPRILFNYFADGDADLNIVVNQIKKLRSWFPLGPIKDFLVGETLPGPHVKTDKQIADYVKKNAWGHHACCTAKMGPKSDSMAVLDNRFRVHGIKGLRVVDNSVFPKIPGFFVAVPVYMISEKAADTIIADAKSQH